MAPPLRTLRVGRYFMALLLIFLALYAVVGFGSRHSPKLGIDLVGGKRAIFAARTNNGTAPTSDSMDQARQIIENRVNAQGVTGATVQVQNDNQLVVIIPGGTQGDVAALGQPAVLNFRGLVTSAVPVTCTTKAKAGSATTSPSPSPSSTAPSSRTSPTRTKAGAQTSHSGDSARSRPLAAAPSTTGSPAATKTASTKASSAKTGAATSTSSSGPSGSSTPTGAGASTAAGSATAAPTSAAPVPCTSKPFAALTKSGVKVPTTEAAYNKLTSAQQSQIASELATFKCSSAVDEPDVATSYYIACDTSGSLAFLLSDVIVPGSQISSASAIAPSSSGQSISGDWSVQLNLKSQGSSAWANWTGEYHSASTSASPTQCGKSAAVVCSVFVGFTLNGEVISYPQTNEQINGLPTSITGNFTQSSADDLAKELNYGSLPLSFKLQSNEDVSATLGSVQLRGAFLAGGIGLILVVIYSLAYYRGLGLVTIASLLVSAGLTYAMLVILGTQIGFTLDLAGIAGFIVALGITADSFVVFFERIKDEVHEGRSMRVAVPRAWIRARRTILSADTVSFLAAAILYYFASADVKGFAFTLGLSTILDLVVVFLFTHPIVSLLSRSRTFGSPRFTGLNSVRTGAAIDDRDSELPQRRGPARAGAASARDRATGRRGGLTRPVRTSEPGTTQVVDDADETVDGGGIAPAADPAAVDPDEAGSRPPGEGLPSTGSSGATAAERAAARRARRRAQGDGDEKES